MKLMSRTMATLTTAFLLAGPALAGPSVESFSFAPVPELDGGMAAIALGLTAAIAAIIAEMRK
jgi:hypothetical protein